MTTRRRYSDAVKAEIAARLLAGQTTVSVAHAMDIPQATVAMQSSAVVAISSTTDYRLTVVAEAKRYAAQAWLALDTQLQILSDDAWCRDHPEHVFGIASAQRVLAETLARVLSVI